MVPKVLVRAVFLLGLALPCTALADEGGTVLTEGLLLSGFVQAQYEHHDDSGAGLDEEGRPRNLDRFEVPRGHVRLEYSRYRFARVTLETDASSRGVSLYEATVALLFPFSDFKVDLTLGLFRVPFGFETQQSPSENLFLEPSFLSQTFFPGQRDFGFQLRGKTGPLDIRMAVVNGNPIGDEAFPGADPNRHKDLVARFGLHFDWVDIGVSGQVGKEYVPGRDAVPARTVWTDRNDDAVTQPSEVTTEPAIAAVPYDNVGRSRLGLDAQLTLQGGFGRLSILFEFASEHREGLAQRFAWYGAVVHQFFPFLGIGLRLEGLDPDTDKENVARYMLESEVFLYPLPAMRITLAYDYRSDQRADARRREGTFVSENAFVVRAQMTF